MIRGPRGIWAELYRDIAGEWRFRIMASNGKIIAVSEGYQRAGDAVDTASLLTSDVRKEGETDAAPASP